MKNKTVKKIMLSALSFAVSVAMLASCSDGGEKKAEGDKKVYKIGVTQIADHPSLDNCRNGFIEGLKEAGFNDGENVEIDFQSAKNDTSTANQIAQNFVSGGFEKSTGSAFLRKCLLFSLFSLSFLSAAFFIERLIFP